MVEKRQRKSVREPVKKRRTDLVPTGSTLLNLALSGEPDGGFKLGTICNVIGDSSSGKTFLAWQMFAEVIRDTKFDGYQLIFDDAEAALLIDIEGLFGKSINRVRRDIRSSRVEEFFVNIRKIMSEDKPFIYCLDSLDSLFSKEHDAKKDSDVGRREIPSEPRVLSQLLRRVNDSIKDTESLLMIVSQTRKNIGVVFGSKQRRAGGDALRFFSCHEMWMAIRKHIKRKERDVGVVSKCKVMKNKLVGRQRMAEFPILFDYGIDDLSSMIAWMVEEGFWKKEGQSLRTDYGKMTEKKLINYIEDNNLEKELQKTVEGYWSDIESEIKTNRKRRY